MGSWKIIETSLPRTSRISSSVSATRSRSRNQTCPAVIRPFFSSSRMIDNAVMLFPEPDSPTSPTVALAGMVRLTPSTALTVPP